jgi:hypothetical protein
MKQIRAVCLLSACAFLAGGCALEQMPDEAAGPKAERVYITGSNIAKRNPGNVTVLDREEAQRDLSLHTGMPMPMPGGAH